MRALRIAALLSLAGLLLAGSAQASYDPLASGQARLTLSRPLRALLHRNHIKLAARKGASIIAQKAAILPLAGGEADPTIEKGTWELGGELVLQAKRKAVPLTFLAVKSKPSPLYAKVGGGQQKLARAKTRSFRREGFGYGYEAKGLKLSAKTATRLDKRLDTHAFAANQPLGSIRLASEPATVTILPAGRATLVFAPAFIAKLNGLFVALNPIFAAEHQGATFTFPIIINGAISPDASQGILRTGGEVEFLQLGGGQVFWREPWFELGAGQLSVEADVQPSPPYEGKTARIAVAVLGQGAVSSDPSARTITDSGAPLALLAQSAATLNEAFDQGKEDFKAGEALGTISFTAQGQ